MTDLTVQQPPIQREVVLPFGKALSLDSPTDQLGLAVANLRELKQAIDDAVRLVSDELLSRADRDATWTVRANGIEITLDGPGRTEIPDPEALWRDLGALALDGVITKEAIGQAVEQVVTFKPRKAGITALRKLGGRVAEVIERHERPAQRPRLVRVKVG